MTDSSLTIDVHAANGGPEAELAELREALASRPRSIPTRYHYDDAGSALFEEITQVPEYYLTRTETALLREIADEVAALTAAVEFVELGSGAAVKTRILLDALRRAGTLDTYLPFDVSEGVVRHTAEELARHYPGLGVHGIVGDFTRHLELIPPGQRRLIAFLGSTIGNLTRVESLDFLGAIGRTLRDGEYFLLGTDLIKDVAVIEAAYNDARGVTPRFSLNILEVLNQRFGADFDRELFEHRATYDRDHEWVDIRLVTRRAHKVRVGALDLTLELERGEELRTEISTKYSRAKVAEMLAESGLVLERWHTDPREYFALSLARRAPTAD